MNSMIQKLFKHETQTGLLALAPFFLVVTSFNIGLDIGLIIAVQILILSSLFYFLRKLIPTQQRLAVIVIISVSLMLIVRLLLDAEFYSVANKIGLFLPLLIVNSLVLMLAEGAFSKQDYKSVICHVSGIVIAIPVFFILFGLLKELLEGFSIVASSAGCFFLVGIMFATINIFNNDNVID